MLLLLDVVVVGTGVRVPGRRARDGGGHQAPGQVLPHAPRAPGGQHVLRARSPARALGP